MRVLVQRVTSARVTVDGQTVGEITPNPQGLVALVGLTHTDDAAVVPRRVRAGLARCANTVLECGRHESAIGHFHRQLVDLLDGEATR